MFKAREIQARYFFLTLYTTSILSSFYYRQVGFTPILRCPFKWFTGIPCPSCGMTRGFICIAGGDLDCALSENIFSPLVFLAFLIAIVHLSLEIFLGRKILGIYSRLIYKRHVVLGLVISLFFYNIIRLIQPYSTGELALSFASSPLGKIGKIIFN